MSEHMLEQVTPETIKRDGPANKAEMEKRAAAAFNAIPILDDAGVMRPEHRAEPEPITATPITPPKKAKAPKPQPKGSEITDPDITSATEKPAEDFKAKFAEMQSFVGLIPTEPQLAPPEVRGRGRPTTLTEYSPQTIDLLFSLLAEGYSLNRIGMREDMPNPSTVRAWALKNSAFYARYAHARDLGLTARAENLRDEIALHPDPIKAKLLFDHDKWYLSKMLPKFADRVQADVNVRHEHTHVIDATQLSGDELEKLEDVLRSVAALPAPDEGED